MIKDMEEKDIEDLRIIIEKINSYGELQKIKNAFIGFLENEKEEKFIKVLSGIIEIIEERIDKHTKRIEEEMKAEGKLKETESGIEITELVKRLINTPINEEQTDGENSKGKIVPLIIKNDKDEYDEDEDEYEEESTLQMLKRKIKEIFSGFGEKGPDFTVIHPEDIKYFKKRDDTER